MEKIKNTFSIVDDIREKNNELYTIIHKDVSLFNDQRLEIDIDKDLDVSVDNVFDDADNYDNNNYDKNKKVISISDASDKFNYNLIYAKTRAVITKVNDMFNREPTSVEKDVVVPDLVIAKDVIFDDKSADNAIFDSIPIESLVDNSMNDGQIFTEVNPFEDTVLFTSKLDEVFLQENVKSVKEEAMPDLVFNNNEFKNADNAKVGDEDDNKILSLDEQVQALYNNDFSKIRRKAA